MNIKYLINCFLMCLLLLQSCSKNDLNSIHSIQNNDGSELLPILCNPIFPNNTPTKSENKKLNLKVDIKSSKEKTVNNYKFTQFNIFNSGSYSIVKAILNQDKKVVSICKQFYIVKENLINKKSFSYIVTMVSFDSFENKSKYNFSYFENKNFNGLMIFSDTNGKIIETIYYKDSKRFKVDFVNKEDAIGQNSIKLLLYENIVTKSFTYDPNITYICADCGSELLEDDFWDFTCSTCGMILGLLDPAYCIVTEVIWIIYPYDPFPSPPVPGDDEGGVGTPPPGEAHLILNTSSSIVPLLSSYTLTLSTVPSGLQLSNIKYYIYGNADQTLYKINDLSSSLFTGIARTPGNWNIKAVANTSGDSLVSDPIMIEMVFPQASDILCNSSVTSYMSNSWNETTTFASPAGRREKGFWIYINSKENISEPYFIQNFPDGPIITGDINTHGSITPTPATLQEINTSPLQGGKYVVAFFHTHTPLTYITAYGYRPVGPSPGDISYSNSINMPGFVYDYIGIYDPYILSIEKVLLTGHDINAPSKNLYIWTFKSSNFA
jgi:hypothetical protein